MTYIVISLVIGFGVGALVGGFVIYKKLSHFREFADEDDEIMQHARQAVSERTNKRLDKIMQAVEETGRITNDGVEELFCISNRTASSYLRKLTVAGRLKREGRGRGTFYTKA